ncbi:MAG: hypothetical protein WCB51_02020 [Candidatus Dormiibacterota bacterium]
MLLDIGSVLAGIGLAALGFVVVILVCVVILRLLAAILPSYEDRTPRGDAEETADGPAPATDPATAPGDTSADEKTVVSATDGDQPG